MQSVGFFPSFNIFNSTVLDLPESVTENDLVYPFIVENFAIKGKSYQPFFIYLVFDFFDRVTAHSHALTSTISNCK